MRAIRTHRTLGINVIQKYLNMNNVEEAAIAYDYYVGQHMREVPELPSRDGLAAAIDQIFGKKDRLTPQSPKLADRSVLEEVIKSGFVSALYR
ncbi:MAG TPA: hypothetical protein VIB79_17310 [Candidatus Binatia bacterium]|jgi:hypothetical protein